MHVDEDGSLVAAGRRVTEPLVVDTFGSTVRLRGARLVEKGPTASLWAPAGNPRLSLYAVGRYYDGWLANAGAIYLWPAEKGERFPAGCRCGSPRRATVPSRSRSRAREAGAHGCTCDRERPGW